jgi:hypothetical protein
MVGGAFAVDFRAYLDGDAVVDHFVTPSVYLEGGAAFALPHDLAVVPALRIRDDLVSTLVHRGAGPLEILSPWQVDLVVMLRLRP